MSLAEEEALRRAWQLMAPKANWRGVPTGWTALDLMGLAQLIHDVQPVVVVLAGDLGRGGLGFCIGDLLDLNQRGRVIAGEAMSRERAKMLPRHRRVQWVPVDLRKTDVPERATAVANPVVVVVNGVAPPSLAALPTTGSYLVQIKGANRYPEEGYVVVPSRDSEGLSDFDWLLRVPS